MKYQIALVSLILSAACSTSTDSDGRAAIAGSEDFGADAAASEADGDESEEVVPPDAIPAAVKLAALAAVPGLVIEEAELEQGGQVYCVHGRAGGVFCEVEVSADGKVIEVEQGDEDEAEEEGDDDDDGDDDDGDDDGDDDDGDDDDGDDDDGDDD